MTQKNSENEEAIVLSVFKKNSENEEAILLLVFKNFISILRILRTMEQIFYFKKVILILVCV